jgi:hypothetical protein
MPARDHWERQIEAFDRELASDRDISKETYADLCEEIADRFRAAASAARDDLAAVERVDSDFAQPHHGHADEPGPLIPEPVDEGGEG